MRVEGEELKVEGLGVLALTPCAREDGGAVLTQGSREKLSIPNP